MFDKTEPVSAFAVYSKINTVNTSSNAKGKRKTTLRKNNIASKKPKRLETQINGKPKKRAAENKLIVEEKKQINGNKQKKVVENKEVVEEEKPKQMKVNDVASKKSKRLETQMNGNQKKKAAENKLIVEEKKQMNGNKQKKVVENKEVVEEEKPKQMKVNDEIIKKAQPEIISKQYKKKTVKSKPKPVQIKNKRLKRNFQKCSSGYFFVDNYDSVQCGEKMFNWLLNPLQINKFLKENWEKHPIVLQRNCPKYYSNLLTCEDIDKALRTQQLYFTKNIDITSFTPETGLRETHNPPGRATAPLVWDFYANGCSIRILNPQTFFPKIHALNASLQEYFGCFVGANVYLTPADSQGFAPHFDDIEAFVIQLEGEKFWKIYAPRSPSEVLPRFSSGNFTESDLGEPIQQVLLKAGDFMYFPRGFIHQGVALGNKHSLHITLSVYQRNSWADLLETLMPAALKSAIEEDVSFREGLPFHYLSNLGLVHSDKSSEIRTNFLNKLHNLIVKLVDYAPVDAAVDQLGKKFIHDSLPPFLRQEEKETTVFEDGERIKNGQIHSQAELCLASKIKLIRYNCIRMLREEDAIRIYYSISNSKEYHEEDPQFLEIDEDLAPAIDALINSYPNYISVEDLPIDDDIAKVQIASDLWENGILKTEEPLSYLSD